MKILVCTDGSDQSQKALARAAEIADGCKISDLAVIYVYEAHLDISSIPRGKETITEADLNLFKKINEDNKEDKKKILDQAISFLQEKGIKARPIFKEGHPSHTIVSVASDEGFDMIILGSRGLGGLKKVFLGSVSSTVVQEAEDCTVVIVK